MDLLRDISLLIGIWVAIYSINAWRREFLGKRQIELAEETLALFYEASYAIADIRRSIGYSVEFESVVKCQNESEEEFKSRKQASVVFYRYKYHKEFFSRIYSLRYRFMAIFGKEKSVPFDKLNEIVNEILLSARMLARIWHREDFLNKEGKEAHYLLVQKHESVIWDQGDNDILLERIDKIIKEIESTCRDIIVGKNKHHYFLCWKWKPKM